MPNILEEYCRLTDEYRNKYGHKTIVLMQCGKFFEVYSPGDQRDTDQLRVCENILGFRVTYKKKEGHYMAGVNVCSYKRHEKKLKTRVVIIGKIKLEKNNMEEVSLSESTNL